MKYKVGNWLITGGIQEEPTVGFGWSYGKDDTGGGIGGVCAYLWWVGIDFTWATYWDDE